MWKRYIAPVMLVSGSATVFRRPEDKVTHHARKRTAHYIVSTLITGSFPKGGAELVH